MHAVVDVNVVVVLGVFVVGVCVRVCGLLLIAQGFCFCVVLISVFCLVDFRCCSCVAVIVVIAWWLYITNRNNSDNIKFES